jgi:class 3 adenylate cyclase
LVAVFGLLSDPEGAADLALRAAVEIAETVLECFGGALRVGIGLNSGPIVAGSVGGGGRLEYMLIGDPVNVASRVERLTRATGDTILLTEETSARLTRRPDGLARRGEISVKGKSRPLRVYGLTP